MRLAFAGLVVSGAALLVACGGSSGPSNPPTAASTTAPAATATRPAATSTVAPAATATSVAATLAPIPPSPAAPAAAPSSTDTPPPPPPPPPPTTEPPPASGVTLTVLAPSESFSPRSLSAPAGSVTIVFDNQDTYLTHNIHFFSKSGSIGMTDIMTGPVKQTLALGALAPGSYPYKCDVHPQTMTGVLTVS